MIGKAPASSALGLLPAVCVLAVLAVSQDALAQSTRPAPQAARPPAARLPPPYREPKVGVRPFFLVTGQRFLAGDTFEAVFGRSVEPFWGGGVNVHFAE